MRLCIIEPSQGRDRGQGRHHAAVLSAAEALGHEIETIQTRLPHGPLDFAAMAATRSLAVRRARCHLLHCPSVFDQPAVMPAGPTLCSVLDVIPLELRSYRRTGLKVELAHRSARRFDHIMTISDHAKTRIVELMGIDAARITVNPLPVQRGQAVMRAGAAWADLETTPYVIAFDDARAPDPRKRYHRTRLLAPHLRAAGVRLVVVGPGTDAASSTNTVGLGSVLDEELWWLLERAAALYMPSAAEGQGMPVLEANACGTPAIVHANSSLVEVAGTANVVLPEIEDDEAAVRLAAQAIVTVIADRERIHERRAAAFENSAKYSVARFTARLDELYRRVVSP